MLYKMVAVQDVVQKMCKMVCKMLCKMVAVQREKKRRVDDPSETPSPACWRRDLKRHDYLTKNYPGEWYGMINLDVRADSQRVARCPYRILAI